MNRVLRTTCESKKRICKRKLQNEELRDFQFSPNSIHTNRPRTKWARKVPCTVEKRLV